MAAKIVELHERARAGIVKGATEVVHAARVTLGPRGRNVLIQKSFGAPQVTKDGVTVVKELEFENRFENIGAGLLREIAQKTADVAGDGTTTATVLAGMIVSEGIKLLAAGVHPMALKRGIDSAVEKAVAAIRAMARPVKDHARMVQVATIASNGDERIGNIVADAMRKVGKEGVITVEEARGIETTLDMVEGLQFDKGYVSPYFATDQVKMTAELEEPLILLYDKKISTLHDLVPLLEKVLQNGRPLLIVADDVDGEALAALVLNKLRGSLRVVAVKAPAFSDRRKAMLEDIAILTGGAVVAEEAGMKLENTPISALGRAKRVLVDKDNTTIVGGAGKKANIEARMAQLRQQIAENTSEYEREQLTQRLAKLSGGVAVIKVGGATEVEVREKKDRVDDAVHALRAAVEEGMVPGGGVALVRAQKAVRELKLAEDNQPGVNLVLRAMAEPLRQIGANAGAEPALVYNKVVESKDDWGFNAASGKYEDLVKAGVIDPAKVVRIALENAASVASLLITTEAAIVEKPQKPAAHAHGHSHGGMGDMGGMGGMGGMGMGGMGMGGMGGMDDMGDDF